MADEDKAGHRPTCPGLALIEPDRPHNLGAALRLAACLGIGLEIVEPAGFPLDDRRIREGSLDYAPHVRWTRHASLDQFLAARRRCAARTVLLTTASPTPFHAVAYHIDDLIVVGAEARGAPPEMHAAADLRVAIPMPPGPRSFNLVIAAAIVLGEVMRQTGGFNRLAVAQDSRQEGGVRQGSRAGHDA